MNIHLLPTDNLSRLYTNMQGVLSKDELKMRLKNQNIYITSDEEIKEGDWFIKDNKPVRKSGHIKHYAISEPKIILTTDQHLIKDGVQPIDDEFLEWFVKNPSCEFVKVEVDLSKHNGQFQTKYGYKIIIPKEEPNPFELPKALPDDVFYESLEPKQETLEEAKNNYVYDTYKQSLENVVSNAIDFGAKWQSKKRYSEEEVLELILKFASETNENEDLLYHFSGDFVPAKEWFEKYKKK